MKLSVIFGVLHMTMGIITKGTNCVYFRDWPSLVTEVIAGLIILLGLFGWMDLLIIAKWLCDLDIDTDETYKGGEMEQIHTESEIPEENFREPN
jgi:V-type H+-transporting ATPase subunit a